jgi:dTDP-4-dehydrorhamnose reductase
MKILVTGAAGQVGREVVEHGRRMGDDVIALDRISLDVANRAAVHQAIDASKPDVVVHCAAWTAVDACEGDPDRAMVENADAPGFVAEACALVDAHLIVLSTDYVFDGTKPSPYIETDATNPLSVYGRSKLAGEHAVLAALPSACVVRTSWVCGQYGSNMVKTILRLAATTGPLRFVSDQYGHPSFADDLATMLRHLAADRVAGVVHATNQGAVSWYEFAQEVLRAAGDDPSRVQPIATTDLHPPRPAPRPANSVLRNGALEAAGFALLPDFREPLARLVAGLR